MEFRIASTFTDSLDRLQVQEQKAAKIAAFDLQQDQSGVGKRLHKIERAKDAGFWSVRVSADLRMIVHRAGDATLLCYVDHHDDAYRWAERRRIERHPATGAAQLVELPEVEAAQEPRVGFARHDDARPTPPPVAARKRLFAGVGDDDLLGYGVPTEWLGEVRDVDEDGLFALVGHLPDEAAEALLDLAVGETPPKPVKIGRDQDPFAHPDARRRFRLLTDEDELRQALEFPWERWTVFLHPAQRAFVERAYNGPARVSGSAGTGKTIVALHRAVWLARAYPNERVLLTTFSKALAGALAVKLGRLIGHRPEVASRVHVQPVHALAYDLHGERFGRPNIAPPSLIRSLLEQAAKAVAEAHDGRFTPAFLRDEWRDVADGWQLRTWDEYRDVQRLGRKTRLGPRQREALWAIVGRVREGLQRRNVATWAEVLARVAESVKATGAKGGDGPFAFVVADEAQDLGVAELRFLAALAGGRQDSLFFTGDLGQRIFQTPFSWKALGIDLRGRSGTLKVNYRTSHRIRRSADQLLPDALADVDGNTEGRRATVSIFDGPEPEIALHEDEAEEIAAVGKWIAARLEEGLRPEEIGVFVRVKTLLNRARAAVRAARAEPAALDDKANGLADRVAVGTMHAAKGLEFRAVAVMACDDEVLPLPERIEAVGDEADLEEVYATERHLLYVACTRARERLLLTAVKPGSEFLDDMRG